MLLIDGYNLLFKVPGAAPARIDESRERLVRRIAAYCAATGRRARVFFDPGRRGSSLGFVKRATSIEEVQLAEVSADEAIRSLVTDSSDRTQFRVVSSDREVWGAAAKRGFPATSSEDFLAELEASERGDPREKPDGCSPAEAAHWLKVMGLGGKGDEAR